MKEQPEALRLADALETQAMTPPTLQAAAELRRLHEVNQELLEVLKLARKQLEIWEVMIDSEWGSCRDLDEIEADGALHPTTRIVRTAIAKATGEQA